MATTTFLKFDGIDGESTSRDHKGEIELLSWNWGLSSPRPAGGGGGGSGAGKAAPGNIVFVHHYDKASPVLAKSAASGRHIRSAVLSARKSGAGQKDFLKITLKEVFVTSVQVGDDGQGPTEQVAVAYNEVTFSYSPQSAKGGLETPVVFGWDIRAGKVT